MPFLTNCVSERRREKLNYVYCPKNVKKKKNITVKPIAFVLFSESKKKLNEKNLT